MLGEIGYVKWGAETSTWRLAYGVWFLKMYDSYARRGTVTALSWRVNQAAHLPFSGRTLADCRRQPGVGHHINTRL